MFIVAFQLNSFACRGTEGVLWSYAQLNSRMGNESIFVIRKGVARQGVDFDDPSFRAYFEEAFETHELEDAHIDRFLAERGVDVVVVSNSGGPDNFVPSSVPSVVRCVFKPNFPQGTVHAASSNRVSAGLIPVVPDVVRVESGDGLPSLRAELGIPEEALVYGRIGGYDTFDVPFVRDVVRRVHDSKPDAYFIFVHTDPSGLEGLERVFFLPGTRDDVFKRRFIDACDYHLHARKDGETFGVAVGEFAVCGKPTISWAFCGDTEHFTILGDKIAQYADAEDLERILLDPPKIDMTKNGYQKYSPEAASKKFKLALCHAIAKFHPLEIFY